LNKELCGIFDANRNRLTINYPNSEVAFWCPYCLKELSTLQSCKGHSWRCKYSNSFSGIKKIDGKNNKLEIILVHLLSKLCKRELKTDGKMTDLNSPYLDQEAYVYFDLGRPVGFLTTSEIGIKDKGTVVSIDDFFVVEYKRRQGIGVQLIARLLDDIEFTNEMSLAVCSPSINCQQVLNKFVQSGRLQINKLIFWNNMVFWLVEALEL